MQSANSLANPREATGLPMPRSFRPYVDKAAALRRAG
jgi:hypothetical protein